MTTNTSTAPGRVLRCDYAGCTRPGTVERDAWSFCLDHAGRDAQDRAAATRPHRPTPAIVTATPTSAPQPPTQPLGGSIGLLLEQASGHSVAKVRKLGERIENHIDQLRSLLADLAADETRRRQEAEDRAKAAAEIARLETALADARAKLKGKPATAKASGAAKPSTCVDCDAPITRQPGQRGVLPKRCPTHRPQAIR